MKKQLTVNYPVAEDLHARILKSGFATSVVAQLLHTSPYVFNGRLKGYYKLTDEYREKIVHVIDNPDEYRKFPVLHSIKKAMKKYRVGISALGLKVHERSDRLKMILDGFKYIGGPNQEKFYLEKIKEIHSSRSTITDEWVRLTHKKNKTPNDRERIRQIYNDHLKKIKPKDKSPHIMEWFSLCRKSRKTGKDHDRMRELYFTHFIKKKKSEKRPRFIFDWDILCSQPYNSTPDRIRVRKLLFKYFVNMGIPEDKRNTVVEWLRIYRKPVRTDEDIKSLDSIFQTYFAKAKAKEDAQ